MSADDPVADFLAREQSDMAGLGDEFGDATVAVTQSDYSSMHHDTDSFGNHEQPLVNGSLVNGVSRGSAQPSPVPEVPRVEPETIRKWRAEQAKRLEKKDTEEAKKMDEMKAAGKKELDTWYKQYNDQIAKTKAKNRTDEKEFVKQRDAELPGQPWEKITRLCEFNPKVSKNTKDTGRMRSLLLQMKQGETKA